jgi:hypothetical protein
MPLGGVQETLCVGAQAGDRAAILPNLVRREAATVAPAVANMAWLIVRSILIALPARLIQFCYIPNDCPVYRKD